MRTIERYHGGEPIERESEIWNWHNNTFEKETVVAGIAKHYVDPENLSLDEYLLYAGLCQALMLGYSLESLRYTRVTNGSLFWMYDDCWGEVGWTIIDYYLDRKPAYYAVKRAFAPRRLILRREGDMLGILLANDTDEDVSIETEIGFISFDGAVRRLEPVTLEAAAFSRRWRCLDIDNSHGTGGNAEGLIVAIPTGAAGTESIAPGTLRPGPFRDLPIPPADVRLTVESANDPASGVVCRVRSETYAHAVHFSLPEGAEPEDDYFDLLPGQERLIRVRGVDNADSVGVKPVNLGGGR
jgi:beta-mannosidase